MIFESPHKGLNYHVKDPVYFIDPNTGFREMTRDALRVDFLDASSVASFTDEEGNTHDVIRGGSFDTDEAAARLGWTDEEKAYVEAYMLSKARNPAQPVTLWEPPAPDCPIPERVYAELHPNRVLALASETGQVEEFLAWEKRTQNRPEIVAALERKAGEQKDQVALDEALTA